VLLAIFTTKHTLGLEKNNQYGTGNKIKQMKKTMTIVTEIITYNQCQKEHKSDHTKTHSCDILMAEHEF